MKKNLVKEQVAILRENAQEGIDALIQIEEELNDMYEERKEEIKSLLLSVIAGKHTVLIGPSGTGKSELCNEFFSRITDSKRFSHLLNKTSDPSEVLGTVSLSKLEEDKFERNTKNKLPECEFAFLDEIFKSNSPTLNGLLSIINERVFYNGDSTMNCPLISLVGASNEFPESDESLEALYDRFTFKHIVRYLKDSSARLNMIKNYIQKVNPLMKKNTSTTYISLEDLNHVRELGKVVTISSSIATKLNQIVAHLKGENIIVSDRKINWCIDVIKANCVLSGRVEATESDLSPLRHVLWNEDTEIEKVNEIVDKYAKTTTEEIETFKKSAEEEFNLLLNAFNEAKEKDSTHAYTTLTTTQNEFYQKLEILKDKKEQISNSLKDKSITKETFEKWFKTFEENADQLLKEIDNKYDNMEPLDLNTDLPDSY